MPEELALGAPQPANQCYSALLPIHGSGVVGPISCIIALKTKRGIVRENAFGPLSPAYLDMLTYPLSHFGSRVKTEPFEG